MRVLITGGAGFIGSHSTELLLEQGHEVRVFDDLSTGSVANLPSGAARLHFVHGDIRDERALEEAARGCDAVLHLAAVVSVPESIARPAWAHAVNSSGTLNVLEAARRHGIGRVVLASSAAVYGAGGDAALDEDARLQPLSPYAAQKLMGETYAALYADLHGLSPIALRYFNVFGPRQRPESPYSGVLSRFIAAVTAGRPVTIFGDGGQTRDFIDVRDVARANAAALTAPPGLPSWVFNIGTGKARSVLEAYEAIARLAPASTATVHYAEPRCGDVRHSCASAERAWRSLGFRAEAEWTSSLAETVAWVRERPLQEAALAG